MKQNTGSAGDGRKGTKMLGKRTGGIRGFFAKKSSGRPPVSDSRSETSLSAGSSTSADQSKGSVLVQTSVTLNSIKKVKQFISFNERSRCHVKVGSAAGIYVDGKSIMGLFSICLIDPLDVRIAGNQTDAISLVEKYRSESLLTRQAERTVI